MRVVQGPVGEDGGPAMDLAVSHAVLRRVSRGELTTTLRVYRPRVPIVAFGRRDTHRPGFAAAVQACRDAGFTPVVRGTGGTPESFVMIANPQEFRRNVQEQIGARPPTSA